MIYYCPPKFKIKTYSTLKNNRNANRKYNISIMYTENTIHETTNNIQKQRVKSSYLQRLYQAIKSTTRIISYHMNRLQTTISICNNFHYRLQKNATNQNPSNSRHMENQLQITPRNPVRCSNKSENKRANYSIRR
jgi:hypothetical protein